MISLPLVLLIVAPFTGSLLALLLPSNARNAESTLAGGVALFCLAQSVMLFPDVAFGGVAVQKIVWLPSLGLDLSIRMDGLAWMFCMLIFGIGALVVLYARYYLSPSDPVPRFFSFLQAFMGAMAGVVLSGNLIQIVMFWELTSLFSFLLIGYWHHRADARRGARMALIITGTGGLALMAGMLILGHIVHSYELEVVLRSGDLIRNHPLYLPALVLILLGVFTKSAQFPFHFWLPNAMAAPTPVSAYLHSATMVKAGVFLLARLWPALSGTHEWFWLVSMTGATTMLMGSFWAIFQNDLKALLAYSTISHLGLITLLFGLNTPLAAVAGVFHIMNHATFKASLFMAAGIIDHETGTRDIRRLHGLLKVLPVTGWLAVLATCAMAGVPMFNGFLSKEMFFAETVFLSDPPWLGNSLPVIASVYATFSVLYGLRFISVFYGPLATDLPMPSPHEPPMWMRLPVLLLVIACLLVGIFPQYVIAPALDTAALAVVGGVLPQFSLAIFHGVTAPFIMSMGALAGGVSCFFIARRFLGNRLALQKRLRPHASGQRVFTSIMALLSHTSRAFVRMFSTRRLQPQLLIMTVIAIAGAFLAFHSSDSGGLHLTWGERTTTPATPSFAILWLTGGICALAAAWQAKFHRLAAFLFMSVAGLTTCITFAWFSAPDLALTQLSVEVVTTILILLGLRWLPKRVPYASKPPPFWPTLRARGRRVRDMLLALGAGAGMSIMSYAVMTRNFPQSISPFFLEHALSGGGGANVVNVMLVDFRGFDTFGEITVLAAVALTVYALLRRFRPAEESMGLPQQQQTIQPDVVSDLLNPRQAPDTALGYLMVPAVLVRLLLPLALTVAVYLFMRGHNQPGGGFVAGLVFATAFIIQYMVAGTQWIESRMRLMPQRWMAAGLLLAALTGLAALYFGYPFLSGYVAHRTLPVLGEVHVPSALFFDAGIFALVVGATLLILTALAHQSVRAERKPAHKDAAPGSDAPPASAPAGEMGRWN